VGVSNTAISLLVYYIVVFYNSEFYILGNTLGFIISVLNAYFWNSRFVFKGVKQALLVGLLKAYISYGGTFLANTACLYIFVEYLGISEKIAPIINVAIFTPINFIINKFWTFGRNKNKSENEGIREMR
jgi:putative flippase GtrA